MLSTASSPAAITHLVVRVGQWRCALRASDVAEVMRAQPVRTLGGLPPSVTGFARIRGEAVPVVELSRLLGVDAASKY